MIMPQALKKMAIIAGYLPGESYGLLGPQMAATIICENTPCECIVIAATRDDGKSAIKKALADYFGTRQPVIGFSSLSGNPALYCLAKEFKDEGAITILAGPQAEPDFVGETAWQKYPHRFKGFSENFTFACPRLKTESMDIDTNSLTALFTSISYDIAISSRTRKPNPGSGV